jgi:hypothetical protein
MNHRSVSLLRVSSRHVRQRVRPWALASSFMLLGACDESPATLVVLTDTTAASASRVVLALPFDPAALPAPAPPSVPAGPLGDSVRLAHARTDSAQRSDAAFQRARSAANEAARALAPLDRTTPAYARQFSSWRAMADSAERVRAHRDALRGRLSALRAKLGDAAPPLESGAPTLSRATADSAARSEGRDIAEAPVAGGSAIMTLAPGAWWIVTTGGSSALRLPALRVEVNAGAKDTVEIGGEEEP